MSRLARADEDSSRAGKVKTGMTQLTTRERETLTLMTQGLKYTDIAEYMGISHRTVVAHIDHMKRKLNARTVPHLVAQAYVHGLLPIRGRYLSMQSLRAE
jgi:DNA-binding CsgD family transcriptional regulator